MEKGSPTLFLLNVNHIHQQRLKEGGQSAGHHHIAGTPHMLVQRQAVRQQPACYDEHRTYDEEGDDLLLNGLFLANELATVEAKHDVGD